MRITSGKVLFSALFILAMIVSCDHGGPPGVDDFVPGSDDIDDFFFHPLYPEICKNRVFK